MAKKLWDRTQHCWFALTLLDGKLGYKCALCGAVSYVRPASPAHSDWMPVRYEPLTDAERAMIPVGAGPG